MDISLLFFPCFFYFFMGLFHSHEDASVETYVAASQRPGRSDLEAPSSQINGFRSLPGVNLTE